MVSAEKRKNTERRIAMLTTNYPSYLTPSMLAAAKMVCEGGWARHEAAKKHNVKVEHLSAMMRSNGLRRAPNSVIRGRLIAAISMIEQGVPFEEARKKNQLTTKELKLWLGRHRGEEKKFTGDIRAAVEDGIARGMTSNETAEAHGVPYASLMRHAKQMNVKFVKKSRVGQGLPLNRDAEVVKWYGIFGSLRKTGKKFGISGARVHVIVKRSGK